MQRFRPEFELGLPVSRCEPLPSSHHLRINTTNTQQIVNNTHNNKEIDEEKIII